MLNAGDRVLLEVTLEQLVANFPDSEITVAIDSLQELDDRDDASFVGSFMSWFRTEEGGRERWDWRRLPALPWWLVQSCLVAWTARTFPRCWPAPRKGPRRDLLLAYCRSDVIVSCPGNFFYSGSGLGAAFLLHVLALAYGRLLGKPLYMMPQTIGPLTRRRERWLLKRLLRQMRFVALRDTRSLEPVKQLGVAAERCHVFPDSAFLFHGAGELNPFTALLGHPAVESRPRPYLGVTVIDWGIKNRRFARQAEYERAVSAALSDFLARHGGTVFIFPQVTGPSVVDDDRIPARRVAGRTQAKPSQVVLVDETWSPGRLLAAYGQMDLFLGARLHSNIFALTAGTPVLAIAYQYKTHGVLGMLGLGDWVLDIVDVDESLLTARLELLWQQRLEVRALIQQRLPALQQEAAAAAALIAADYATLARARGSLD